MVYILLGNGFEETEAIAPGDILMRGDVEVSYIAVGNNITVTGAHGIKIVADVSTENVKPTKSDVFVVPGGMGGVASIKSDSTAMELLKTAYKSGSTMAAICAGPSVLAELHITDDKEITCYPGCENMMGCAICNCKKSTIQSDNIITGRAPGSAYDFGLKLLEYVKGTNIALEVKKGLVY